MPGAGRQAGAADPARRSSPRSSPHKPGASYIYRENNRRYIPIKFSVRGRDLASAIDEAQRKVDDPRTGAKLPEGYRIEWSGEFAQMQEANARLMWIVPLSIGLIMVLLYTAFNSIKDALLVMAGVVTATMGGVWALELTGTHVQHLGGRRLHLDLRRRRPERRAADLLLQPDAGERTARPRGRDAGVGVLLRPVAHDLADGHPRPAPRGARQLDRLAGPEAAGDRGRRRDARSHVPAPVPDAGALYSFFPAPRASAATEL